MVVNYLFSFTLSSPLPSWLAFPFSPSFFPHLDAAWLVTFFYGRALRLAHRILHLYRKLLRDINAELKKKKKKKIWWSNCDVPVCRAWIPSSFPYSRGNVMTSYRPLSVPTVYTNGGTGVTKIALSSLNAKEERTYSCRRASRPHESGVGCTTTQGKPGIFPDSIPGGLGSRVGLPNVLRIHWQR